MKLVLVLPVATTTIERIFLGTKIVKTTSQNRISDESMDNILICFVEKEEMMKVTNNIVIHRFMKLHEHKFHDED